MTQLEISKNALGVDGANELRCFLINNKHLKNLIINDAGLGEEGGKIILQSILQSETSILEELSIGENMLGSKCSTLLSEVIKNHHNTLTKLILSRNYFYGIDLSRLITELKSCKKLQVIDFEDNFFDLSASRLLGKVLVKWVDLNVLILNDCFICEKGINYIIESLKKGKNKNIHHLGLESCMIGEKGFNKLAGTIKQNLKMLRKIEVEGNFQIKGKIKSKLLGLGIKITGLDNLIEDDDDDDAEPEEKEGFGKRKREDGEDVDDNKKEKKKKG